MNNQSEIVTFPTAHRDLTVAGKHVSFDLTDPEDRRRILEHAGIAGDPHFARLVSVPDEAGVQDSDAAVQFRLEGNITGDVRKKLVELGATLSLT